MQNVLSYLDDNNISYTLHNHPAAFTVEETKEYCSHIPGMHCKNLFMRDHKGRCHFLLILPNDKAVDLKAFSKKLNDRLSFGSDKRLMKYLGLTPGSVSPFGLINDSNAEVIIYLDKSVYDAQKVTFHPNINTATLELTKDMFESYLNTLDNDIRIVEFD